MDRPNSTVSIHTGKYIIKDDINELVVNGTIDYKWFPTLGVRFEGKVQSDIGSKIILELFESQNQNLYVDDLHFGQCHILNTHIDKEDFPVIKGVLKSKAIFGDKSVNVENVTFSIPNLRRFFGDSRENIVNGRRQISRSQLTFDNDKYKIIVNQAVDYDKKIKSLKDKGGFLVLHSGILYSKKSSISFEEQENVLWCFGCFLSFLNGKRTSAVFRLGNYEDNITWSDYSNYQIDTYRGFQSWPPEFSIEHLNDIWIHFSSLWDNDVHRDFLVTLVHWYIESNSGSGYLEGSIIMAQTALELIEVSI